MAAGEHEQTADSLHPADAVQPHGILLALSPTLQIQSASANAADLLGEAPRLGDGLDAVLDQEACTRLLAALEGLSPGKLPHTDPLRLHTRAKRLLAGVAHRSGERILLELEPETTLDGTTAYARLGPHLDELHQANTLDEMYQAAAVVARRITGYQHVMVYCFAADGSGVISAEDRDPAQPSYLGLRFPALDLPDTLRRLYVRNAVRLIADVDAVQQPIDSAAGLPALDLSDAGLRGLPARYREYLANMGVRGYLSIALRRGDTLRGLIVCQQPDPHVPAHAVRRAGELLGLMVSLRLGELGETARLRAQVRASAVRAQLLARLTLDQPSPAPLLGGDPNVRDLIAADGAAWICDQRVVTIGQAPSTDDLLALTHWLEQEIDRPVFAIRSLEQVYAPAVQLRGTAAGLLAIRLPEPEGGWLLWLRAELPATVAWSSNVPTPKTNKRHPAASFEEWARSLAGCAIPWEKEERDAAAALRDGLVALALRRAERRRRELEAQRREARRLETLGLLAGGLANDFNNLLLAVQANAALAEDERAAGGEVAPFLQAIDQATSRAAELTNQLLAFAGQGRAAVREVDLSALLGELSTLHSLVPQQASLLRRFGATPAVRVDATQIQQVVLNLVLNAAEALEAKPGTITLATGVDNISAESRRAFAGDELMAGRYVWIEVGDDGCGMDEATQKRLFEPFFTTKVQAAAGIPSVRGLGMSAVQGIVRGHGGAVTVESKKGQGSTIRVYLPLETPTLTAASTAPALFEAADRPLTILVVDDEELVIDIAEKALGRAGWRCLVARDGGEAITLFEEHGAEIDVVLLDLTMPTVGGAETWRELRKREANVRVLFSSGLSDRALPIEASQQGCAFLQKPYRPSALLAALKRIANGE